MRKDTGNIDRRRVRTIYLTFEELSEFFKGDNTIVKGLPDDAQILAMWEEPNRQAFGANVYSERFPPEREEGEAMEVDVVIGYEKKSGATHWACPNCGDSFHEDDNWFGE